MNIEHISVSRKQCFDTCHAQYKYRYHLKIISNEPVADHFTYGKIIHKVAEHYVMEKGKKPIEEIASEVLNGKIMLEQNNPSPPLPSQYKKKLPIHLENVKTITDRIGFDGELEWEFNYDIDPPNNKKIKGFIDRLIIRGDKFFILDYKTTKQGMWRKNKGNIGKDLQLRTYGKIIQNHFGAKPENIKAALFYLEGSEIVSTGFTQESLDSAQQELIETYDRIVSSDPSLVVGSVGNHCRFCDYRKVCTFYKN
jgi:CRISPR/Cas system-associated exonuclease Cas4 (RecB family)